MSNSDLLRDFLLAIPALVTHSASRADTILHSKLQIFAQKISLISALADNLGKLSVSEAWKDVRQQWKELKTARKQLYLPGNPTKSDESSIHLVEYSCTYFVGCLRQFAVQVGYLCGLEANGKIETLTTYRMVKAHYKQLKAAYKRLLVTES